MKSVVHTRSAFNITNAATGAITAVILTIACVVFARGTDSVDNGLTLDWIILGVVDGAFGACLGFAYLRVRVQKAIVAAGLLAFALSLCKILAHI